MMAQAFFIAIKDIKTEFRTKAMINYMIIFSLLIILSFKFTIFYLNSESEVLSEPLEIESLVSPVLWVTFTFIGMFMMLFSFLREKDRGSLEGLMLCPMDRSTIYFGKVISNFIFNLLLVILSLIFFALLFSYDYQGNIIPMFLVILLGTFSLVTIGTLVSGISINPRAREALIPVLFMPLILFTVILPSITATSKALEGRVFDAIPELRILGMFAFIYIAIAYILFDHILEE